MASYDMFGAYDVHKLTKAGIKNAVMFGNVAPADVKEAEKIVGDMHLKLSHKRNSKRCPQRITTEKS